LHFFRCHRIDPQPDILGEKPGNSFQQGSSQVFVAILKDTHKHCKSNGEVNPRFRVPIRVGAHRVELLCAKYHHATTVGYGDIRPTKTALRIFAIVIALVGLMLIGILVAVAVHSATVALATHDAAIKVK
jgi:hypothetical protein